MENIQIAFNIVFSLFAFMAIGYMLIGLHVVETALIEGIPNHA